MYTLTPQEAFVLSRLFSADDAALRRAFAGAVFRGHLERGGELLDQLTRIEVTVQRVVYAEEEISSQADLPLSDGLDYIVFGGTPELFLAHRIAQPPDFDQLLGVKLSGHEFTPEEDFARGILITVRDRFIPCATP